MRGTEEVVREVNILESDYNSPLNSDCIYYIDSTLSSELTFETF